MRVFIPDVLLSYTGAGEVEAAGTSIAELFADLDHRYPGLRFRVIDEQDWFRRHMRVFVNGIQTFDLGLALKPGDEIAIIQALSGG